MTAQSRNFNVAAILIAATFCASVFHDSARSSAAEPAPIVDLEQSYRTAAAHFTEAKWDEVAAAFRQLIEEAGTAAKDGATVDDALTQTIVEQSRFYLGESLVRSGKSAAAIDALKPFVAASKDEALLPIARYRLGEACYFAARTAEARDALEALLDAAQASGNWPATTPRALYYLGDLAARDDNHHAAAKWFGMLTAAYPDDELYELAALARIEALSALNEHAAARTALRAYDGSDPTSSARAALLLIRTLEGLNDHAAAATAYDRYLTLAKSDDPRREDTLYDSAWNLRKLDRAADAAARFDEFVRTQPESRLRADASYRAAEYYAGAGKLDEAKSRLRFARSAAGDELLPHVLALELQTALAAQDRELAEAAIDALAKRFPQHEISKQADYWRGEVAYRAEAWDDAAERFAAAIAAVKTPGRASDYNAPWYTAAVFRRVESLAQAARWTDVIKAVDAARSTLPVAAPRYELEYLAGRAHAARAEFREAREAYARVLADERWSGTETAALARFMTAESYFHQRDYATALTEYNRVVTQTGFAEWRAASLLQAGKCEEQLGRRAEAQARYELVLAEFADSPYAADAERRRDAAMRQAEASAPNVQRK